MKKVLAILAVGLESSTVKTSEFKALASAFKTALKKELQTLGATMTAYSVGHFYINGFFRKDGKCYYFSFGDVRGMEFVLKRGDKVRMMYRTANDEKDFRGGGNNWVYVEEGMAENIRR